MGRRVTRAAVCCASGFNWASLVLLIFASASNYWSWGTSTGLANIYVATASTGPWLAGSLWSTYAVPCNCVSGWCYSYCYIGTSGVFWSGISAEAACGPSSIVYQKWSGPLGYCSFPGGTTPPTPAPSEIPSNATGEDQFGNVPAGTTFNTPSQITAVQGLIIIATITVFFAAVAGCIDAGVEESGNLAAGGSAACCSLLGFVFALSAYCVWAAFPYIQSLQSASPTPIWIPVWVNEAANQLSAVQANGITYGPGFAVAITASIVTFFCMLVHCASLVNRDYSDFGFGDKSTGGRENVTPQPGQPQGVSKV